MRKQKLMAMILTAMVLCICACSNNSNKEKETVNLDEFTIPVVETKQETTQEVTTKEEETKEEKISILEEIEGYTPGEMTETKYKNEYFDIQFDVPEGAKLLSRYEISQLTGQIYDTVSDFDYSATYYEMYALTPNGTSVNVVAAPLSPTVSDSNYVRILMDSVEKSSGYSVNIVNTEYGKIAGKKAFVVDVEMEFVGLLIRERLYLLREKNNVLCITMGIIDGHEEEVENFINAFY